MAGVAAKLLDFGAAPGTTYLVATVTGLTGIADTDAVECWKRPVDAGDYLEDEVRVADVQFVAGPPNAAGSSAVVVGISWPPMVGQFPVWVGWGA